MVNLITIQGLSGCILILIPNTEPDQVLYFTHLRELFLTLECGENASFVWGGDFNCPLTNRDVDQKLS